MKVEILILAAGKSCRMNGKNKLLEQIGTLTLLERVIIEAVNSIATKVSIILPSEGSPLWDISGNYPIQRLSVQTKQVGMGYSISCGVNNISHRSPNGVIIVLADMPEIKSVHLDNMIQAFSKNPNKGIVRATTCRGKPGNPVLFSSIFFKHLMTLTGDHGAKNIVSENQPNVQHLPLPGSVASIDLDTPEDWKIWKNYFD
ncbi:MAG: nucleotidyltransferase family protein [Paracoccaceae bacterium]|nr:nucleotidyltransferase family protein [Paracoccaceae bacterium]